jgi:hypothetical protein
MSTRRITISVPSKVAARMKKAAGHASVSAWITGLIEERLNDAELERQWNDFYKSIHFRPDDIRRGDAVFRGLTKPRRKRVA